MIKHKHKKLALYFFLTASLVGILFPIALPGRVSAQTCYNFDGTSPRPCENVQLYRLQPEHCYTERRDRNGGLTGYSETSCDDATDRDMDGNPGGASHASIDGDCTGGALTADNCGIIGFVLIIINVLSAVVGVIVVVMVVIGGIQYTSARDNPQAVAAARQRIINALLALVFYLGITAFLQWVVPGGVFSG